MKGQTLFQALGTCFHAIFAAWKRILFETVVLSHLYHIPRRHLPMSTGIFVCHFKDDCCLCLVDRGQRSFAVSCDAHCSPQSKTMLHSKNGSHVSGQTELDSTVSTKHSQRQAAAVVRLQVWWSRPVLALVVCCFAGFVF